MSEQSQEHLSGEPDGGKIPKLVSALEAGRAEDAVRAFMEAVSSGMIPQDEQLIPKLVSVIGKIGTAKLVEAFVHFPCFYCRKGRISCETCNAHGHTEAGTPCERCLGMRLERCDCCNGSGWVTIDYVPEGLQPLVIRGRATLATRRMRSLLDLPLPDVRSNPQAAIKRAGLSVLSIDRQVGVFENMFMAVGHLSSESQKSKQAIESLVARCVVLGARAETRICELVRVIAGGYRRLAELTSVDSKDRIHLLQLATHYEALVDPEGSLAGTGLEHTFLHEAIVAERKAPTKRAEALGENQASSGEES